MNNNKLKSITLNNNLNRLQQIWLISNRLTELPNNIHSLDNLEELYLFENCIKQLNDNIRCMNKLHTLHIGNNKLSHIPQSLSQLQNINYKNNPI